MSTQDTMSATGTSTSAGRHAVNVGHLVMGIAFVGLVGVWALIQGDVVDGSNLRWLLPVPWVLAGLAGLLATTVSGRRNEYATTQRGWVGRGDESPGPFVDPNTQLYARIDAAASPETTTTEPADEDPGPEPNRDA